MADELLEINILAIDSGKESQVKEKIKQLFKDLHSSTPDLNAIHAEIEQLKKDLGQTSVDKQEEKEETEAFSSAPESAPFSHREMEILDRMLDLNVKIAEISDAEKSSALKDKLRQLRHQIGNMDDSQVDKAISEIEAEL